MTCSPVSVVIPTYGREQVLVATVSQILSMPSGPAEVLIIDQTPEHQVATDQQLSCWDREGCIRWIRLTRPSIPEAMNAGLQFARNPLVLFLDDDIVPDGNLIAAHAQAYKDFPEAWAVAGQVLQPGESPGARNGYTANFGLRADLNFPFWSDEPAWVANVMAGNLSLRRDRALAAGGFDENFQGSAYRFETEFSRRLIMRGGRIRYAPEASIRHLRAERGGTRAAGSHLTSASPRHGVGDYYFALLQGCTAETMAYMSWRMVREVCTRFHLRHPWWIPVKLLGELRGLVRATRLRRRGQRLIEAAHTHEKY